MKQKRIVTLQDLSCFGKCSLTVAHPVLSAMGLESCSVPTALLSTHSGFAGWTYKDLTSEMIPIARHWKDLGLAFDTISIGYLGGMKQLREVSDFLQMFPDAVRIIDPAFADRGKFERFPIRYRGYLRRCTRGGGHAELVIRKNHTPFCRLYS